MTRRERSEVAREVSSIPVEIEPAAPLEPAVAREGLERPERLEAAEPSHVVGTCRLCQMGQVVMVRRDHSRHNPDIRALCLFCHRDLEPHEVEPA